MKRVDAVERDVGKEFNGRSAVLSDCDKFIDFDCNLYINEKLSIVYRCNIVDPMMESLRESLLRIKYSTSSRTGGLVTTSRIFGYSPRLEMRNAPCRSTSLSTEDPQNHGVICASSLMVDNLYKSENPDLYKKHLETTIEKVGSEWIMENTCFTSGIANDCNPLRYHYDAGNFPSVWSGMIVLKKGVSGGHLCVPEISTSFDCGDKSIILFDGQGLLHGVTPIKKTSVDGRRFSVVYYSLRQMWQCLGVGDEIDRLRNKRTSIEKKRASDGSQKQNQEA